MTLPVTFATLLIAAAALIPATAALAAPLSGPLALGEAAVAPIVQAQARYSNRAYRSYARAYGYRGYAARHCIRGEESETSAYPSWQVCHRR